MDESSSVLYIAHHGIKGQRWKIRRYQYEDGSLTPEGRIRYGKGEARKSSAGSSTRKSTSSVKAKASNSDDSEKSEKKALADLTDDELRSKINRLSLEKQYRQLSAELTPPKENKAKRMISEMVETSVKNIGTQAVTYATGTAVNKLCRGIFKIDYDVVNPKKGQKDK